MPDNVLDKYRPKYKKARPEPKKDAQVNPTQLDSVIELFFEQIGVIYDYAAKHHAETLQQYVANVFGWLRDIGQTPAEIVQHEKLTLEQAILKREQADKELIKILAEQTVAREATTSKLKQVMALKRKGKPVPASLLTQEGVIWDSGFEQALRKCYGWCNLADKSSASSQQYKDLLLNKTGHVENDAGKFHMLAEAQMKEIHILLNDILQKCAKEVQKSTEKTFFGKWFSSASVQQAKPVSAAKESPTASALVKGGLGVGVTSSDNVAKTLPSDLNLSARPVSPTIRILGLGS